MSHSSKIFEEAPVKVQNRNGFDLSHLVAGTSKCGQLVPVLTKLLPPNTKFTLGANMEVNLPPLATKFYGRVDAIIEGFVVPCSMLYGGWKQFISNQQNTMFTATQQSALNGHKFALPYVNMAQIVFNNIADYPQLLGERNLLLDMLGWSAGDTPSSTSSLGTNLSLLPLLAYHLIWDVYYRNKQVTNTIFAVNSNYATAQSSFNSKNVSLIWHSFYTDDNTSVNFAAFVDSASLIFPDGKSIFSTRQRNYSRDYFTAATPSPQQGNASSLVFDIANNEGEFTINALRAANALQKFLETNNLSGDYADMMRNRWGTKPIDADFDEPYYLGRVVLPVYQRSVYQQQDTPAQGDSSNPFVSGGNLGAAGAAGGMSGSGSICDKFTSTTWAYVMCLFSLVPHAMYGRGLNRELLMRQLGDFPAPELQTVGNEAIMSYEIDYYFQDSNLSSVFGYIPRYSRFKYMDDRVFGELRPGRTLESFVLQRRVASPNIKLSTSFLEIPQNALDSVFAVSTANMHLSCWFEIFFEFKVSMPLADFCIPTLGDIQDTHTIHSKQGGSRL